MKRRLLGALGLLVLGGTAMAADALPAFRLLRFEEDWSVLRDDPARAPAYKFVALSDESFASFGGEWRLRLDSLAAPRYGLGRVADSYALQRVLVHADWHITPRLRLFAQLGREDAIGKKAPLAVSDSDRGDVQNLFLDMAVDTAKSLNLRLGRQELMFSPLQRFVSVREGPNVRQGFDGLRASWRRPALSVDLFATRPVAYAAGAFDDATDRSQAFQGVYLSRNLASRYRFDAYYFGLRRDGAVLAGSRGRERRDSAGLRLAGSSAGFDLDMEALGQGGHLGPRTIRAWAFSAIAGYTASAAWSPRYALEYDIGSGDSGRPGSALGTFNPLFPKGAYFDESGLMSWANARVLRASASVQPTATLSLKASLIGRWRQNTADAVYLQPYVALPQTLANRERRVGSAYVVDAAWRIGRSFNVALQLSRHQAGPAIRRAGGDDVDFAMLLTQYRY
ncbi:alginate export protein [Tahibacter aquaticus]|uniref:Alginate export protein n=1 Tax=Tahibacter aquaticus TaxID=520092 RepID=A0A4R6Z0H9_9GAMM|nr:alginate export family protein [Tahibacter aquaticus]TDR45002.1 alginate export protein [Tahibacter aquaticus]